MIIKCLSPNFINKIASHNYFPPLLKLSRNCKHFVLNFVSGCTGSSLLCAGFLQLVSRGYRSCAQASHYRGFSCCGAWAPGCAGLCNCSMRSIVVARGPTSLRACGIFLDQGSNLCLLYWKVDSLPLSPQGSLSILLIVVTAGYHLQKNYLPLSLVLLSVRIW